MTNANETAANTFRATLARLNHYGASDAAFELAEADARFAHGVERAATDAALSFACGFDFTAVETLVDAGIRGAERIVRRMRIEIADAPNKWCLPR